MIAAPSRPVQLVLDGPRSASVRPASPATTPPEHARVRVAYVGLCGVDHGFYTGHSHYLTAGHKKYPFVPGHEWSGTIDALGPHTTGFAIGDRVVGHNFVVCGTCRSCHRDDPTGCDQHEEIGVLGHHYDGAAATYFITPVSTLHAVPDEITTRDAALIEPATTAHHAIRRTGVSSHDRVAVLGTGTTGLCAVQIAKSRSAHVTAIGIDDAGLALARQLGADRIEHFDERSDTRYDIVLECSGSPAAAAVVADLVNHSARVGLVGIASTPVDDFRVAELVTSNVTVHGVLSGLDDWPATIDLAATGRLNLDALIHSIHSLADATAAFDDLHDPSRPRPKILLEVGSTTKAHP